METKQQQILEEYCSNEMQKLKQLCFSKISKIGGISQMDHDDLYSIALDVLRDSVERYDGETCKFSTFLSNNIQNKFDTYVRDRNRRKRSNTKMGTKGQMIYLTNVSIDAPTEDGVNLAEKVASSFNIEGAVSEEIGLFDDKIQAYMSSLTSVECQIAKLIMGGYDPHEIREKLHLTDKQYTNAIKDMRTFEKARVLNHTNSVLNEGDKKMQNMTQTFEKSKTDKLSIESIIKRINNYTIRFDHPLQRASEQWSPVMKGNLISDILQGNPIPPLVFAEQIVNDIAVIWDLDGKQRCTNVYSFAKNTYKISKNIRRWNIKYQSNVKDECGNDVLCEDGSPKVEWKEYDIRGKKYSDLPEELQDKLKDYNFEITQYLNCSSEDIAYHIARYNEGKPMTASQKGLTRLGEDFALMVRSISNMPFFRDQGGYKASEFRNGTINRVVVESIMAADYIDDWKKQQEEMCTYIKENATTEIFDNFEEMVQRLSEVVTDETADMFDAKDSFLWFGLFAKFTKTGEADKKFVEFMAEFARSLHNKEIDGVSYDDLNGKSTKDKGIVLSKMDQLEKLLADFLQIEFVVEDDKNFDLATFVEENVNQDITEEDITLYNEVFDDLILNVDNKSKLLEANNKPSFIALIAYSFFHDIDLDDWIVDYFADNSTYDSDQKKNFLHMIEDLHNYMGNRRLPDAV